MHKTQAILWGWNWFDVTSHNPIEEAKHRPTYQTQMDRLFNIDHQKHAVCVW